MKKHKNMKKHKFIVEVEILDEVNITEMKHYIYDSIITLCESQNTLEDPLYALDQSSIKVVHATRAKAAELLSELKLKGKRKISMAAAQIKNYGGTSNYGK